MAGKKTKGFAQSMSGNTGKPGISGQASPASSKASVGTAKAANAGMMKTIKGGKAAKQGVHGSAKPASKDSSVGTAKAANKPMGKNGMSSKGKGIC